MSERSEGPSSFRNPEAAYGGADAVNDTPAVAGHGTEPEQPKTGTVRARVRSGTGVPALGWLLLALIAIVVLAYVLGMI
jgi:hypothetical protein